MASKYEILASVVDREHEHWVYMTNEDGDGTHHLIIGALRIMHRYETGPRPGGPNNPVDWEEAVDEIFEMLASGYSNQNFDLDEETDPATPASESGTPVAPASKRREQEADAELTLSIEQRFAAESDGGTSA
jgi:hypothetical protein